MKERKEEGINILRVVGKRLYLRRGKKKKKQTRKRKRKKTLFVGLRFVSVNESCKKT